MSPHQAVWTALILAQAIVSAPSVIHLLGKRTASMPILPEFQAAIDELNASVAAVQALRAAAPSPQDLTDTQVAVQAAADAMKAAAGQ